MTVPRQEMFERLAREVIEEGPIMKIAFANVTPSTTACASTSGNDYVRTITINGVDDVFDHDALWALPRAWGSDKSRLKGILSNSESRVGSRIQVLSSIVLELPCKAVERDRRIASGLQTEDLIRQLAKRHSNDFKDQTPSSETQPRYSVHAASDLADNQVRVRVGYAIYVPNPDEPVVWKIQTSTDGIIWDGATPSFLSERQRLFILGGHPDYSSQVCSNWPFPSEVGLVILNDIGKDKLDFSAEPFGSLHIDYDEPSGCYSVSSKVTDTDPSVRLYLRATRLLPVCVPPVISRHEQAQTQAITHTNIRTAEVVLAAPIAKTEKIEPTFESQVSENYRATTDAAIALTPNTEQAPGAPESEPDDIATEDLELTFHASTMAKMDISEQDSDDKTYVFKKPVHQASISLEGLAIQRPSMFQAEGVRGLQWGLDKNGGVVSPQSPASVMVFAVASNDAISIQTRSGKRLVEDGEILPLPNGVMIDIAALPQPLAEAYLGWMKLPLGNSQPLETGRVLGVGRHLNALAPLRAFSGKGFLGDGKDSGGDRMGLSRRHFELQVGPDGLLVRALGTNTVGHLDKNMAFVATISADKPSVLKDGHRLVVGHYVWRFDA